MDATTRTRRRQRGRTSRAPSSPPIQAAGASTLHEIPDHPCGQCGSTSWHTDGEGWWRKCSRCNPFYAEGGNGYGAAGVHDGR